MAKSLVYGVQLNENELFAIIKEHNPGNSYDIIIKNLHLYQQVGSRCMFKHLSDAEYKLADVVTEQIDNLMRCSEDTSHVSEDFGLVFIDLPHDHYESKKSKKYPSVPGITQRYFLGDFIKTDILGCGSMLAITNLLKENVKNEIDEKIQKYTNKKPELMIVADGCECCS